MKKGIRSLPLWVFFVAPLLIITLLATGSPLFLASSYSNKLIRERTTVLAEQTVRLVDLILDTRVKRLQKELATAAFLLAGQMENSDAGGVDSSIVQQYYDDQGSSQFDILYMMSAEGNLINVTPPELFSPQEMDELVLKLADAKKEKILFQLTARQQGESFSGHPLIALAAAEMVNRKNGRVIGTLYGGIRLNDNLELIEQIHDVTGEEAFLVQEDGFLLLPGSVAPEKQQAILKTCRRGSSKFSFTVDEVMAVCEPLSLNKQHVPLQLYIEFSNSEVSKLYGEVKRLVVVGLVSLLVLVALVSWFFQRKILKALHVLTAFVGRVHLQKSAGYFPPTEVREFNIVGKAVELLQEHLENAQDSLHNMIEVSVVPIVAWDKDGQIILYNSAMAELTGIPTAEIMGRDFSILLTVCVEDDRGLLEQFARGEQALDGIEIRFRHRESGDLRVALCYSSLLSGGKDGGRTTVLQGADITRHKEVERDRLLASGIFDNIVEAVAVTDLEGKILSVNQAFVSITGYSEEEAIGKSTNILKSNRQDNAFYQRMWDRLLREGHWEGEIWNRRRNGNLYPAWLVITAIRDVQKNPVCFIGVQHDISERKFLEERIRFQVHHDALTNLPNRTLFLDRLSMAIHRAEQIGLPLAVLVLDLDKFKRVNDSLGHHDGDLLLQDVGRRLERLVSDMDTVSRLGGDEFALLLEVLKDRSRAFKKVEYILAQLQEPFTINDQEVFVTASVGMTFYPDDAKTSTQLMVNADVAMYRAKSAGGNGFAVYTEDMNRRAQELLSLESSLHNAVFSRELLVYYQPKVDLVSGRITGMEALVRWQHPEKGLVAPADFIPLAEETGLIVPIGEYVLRTACQQLKQWQLMGFEDLQMAVNLSEKQFRQSNLVEIVATAVQDAGIEEKCLELEITENILMDTLEDAAVILHDLRKMGLFIAIDDFGTGYTSIGSLKKFAVSTVKIDRSFVRDIDLDKDNFAIVKTIIQLAANLGLKVVAEGAEREEEIRILQGLHCDTVQGFYYSRPVPAGAFTTILEQMNA